MICLKHFWTVALVSWSALAGFGQISEIKINELSTNKFPNLTGVLWARDPEGIDTSRVLFEENGQKVDVHFNGQRPLQLTSTSKRIVFLLTNGPGIYDFEINRAILSEALNQGIVKGGDMVDVVGFNCTRTDGKVLLNFQDRFDFTDDAQQLKKRLDEMRYISRNVCVNCGSRLSEINYAVEEILIALEKQPSTLPTAIVVVGDNNGQRRAASGLTPGMRARQLDVAIYGTAFPSPMASAVGSTDILAPETYGKLYKTDDANEAVMNIADAVSQIIPRSEGVYYDFTHTAIFEKDGMAHTIDIISPKKSGDRYTLHAPNMTLMEWVKKNVLISVLILVFFLLLVTVIILLIVQQKKMAANRRAENTRRMEEIEGNQRESRAKIDEDRRRIEQIKQDQERKQQEADRMQMDQQSKREEERLIVKMKERGNFPWFEYFVDNKGGTWQMNRPTITVGRQEGCNWLIQNGTVSRKHFKVSFNGDDYSLEDLGSSNGVVVNGRKVSQCRLRSSDVIEFGNVRATFHI